jgi:hypothetical protein
MKLLSKQREGKKVRYVYDSAKTPLQRLLQSGVLPAEMQQELLEVAHALDPIRLFEQLEQLQQAVFRSAVGCSPFLSSLPSTPLRVFFRWTLYDGNASLARKRSRYRNRTRDLIP